jgi:hypothetical protein
LADTTIRKGAWVLETTEITTALKGTSFADELNKYLALLNLKTNVITLNYTTATPRVQYTSADGDLLDLTFFLPSKSYNGQYKVNGLIRILNLTSLSSGSTVNQQLNSDYLYINCNAGKKVINWNDTSFYTGTSQTVTDLEQIYPNPVQKYLNIRNSDEYSNFRILNLSGQLLKTGNFVNENKISMTDIDKGIYLLTLVGNTKSKTFKIIKN